MADFDTMLLSNEAVPVANITSAWVPINPKTEAMPIGIKNHVDKLNSKTAMSEAMESTVDTKEVMVREKTCISIIPFLSYTSYLYLFLCLCRILFSRSWRVFSSIP